MTATKPPNKSHSPSASPFSGLARLRVSIVALVLGCTLAVIFIYTYAGRTSGLVYEGKSIEYWEEQALIEFPQGHEKSLPVIDKMGPEAIPFWLKRLRTIDSKAVRGYAILWSNLPNAVKAKIRPPIDQAARRSVAFTVLRRLSFTNGIPELIQLCYSQDQEIQRYAVSLLWLRAYHFYRPSTECIAGFCSALKTGDAPTRMSAIEGLSILPLREEALPSLHLALKDPVDEIRIKAAEVIVTLQPDFDLKSMFEDGINSTNENIRVISVVTLSRLKRLEKARALKPQSKSL